MTEWSRLDWARIDTVLLDMDGTLLDQHFDNYFWSEHLPRRYAEKNNLSLEESRRLLDTHLNDRIGSLQWYCLDYWSNLVDMDMAALKHEISHKIRIRPYTEEFLQALRQMGKKLVLITNCHRAGLELKMAITRIDRLLDLVVSSHDYQVPKEEHEFWLRLQQQEHFHPERTLFIDDTPRVLASARRFGIPWLVCINKPDSQMPAKKSGRYIDIEHFDEIMPGPVHPAP